VLGVSESGDMHRLVPYRAFTAARVAGGPHVKLFYNDYSAEAMNAKSDQVRRLCPVL